MRLRRLGRIIGTGMLVASPALAFLSASWQGCHVYDDSLLDAPVSCLARWPPPPAGDDPDGGPDYSGIVAMQTVDVGSTGDAAAPLLNGSAPLPPIGFDLDGKCTCCSGGSACPTGASCVGPSTNMACDDDAGRDRNALQIFSAFANVNEKVSAGMRAGQFSILLQISGYNRTPNDTKVTVALYVSNGLDGIQSGQAVMPRHDGTDRWTVDSKYLGTTPTGATVPDGTQCNGTSACQPLYVDDSAYVTNGVLVSRPPTEDRSDGLPLTLGYRANIGGALMKLNGVVISGTLVASGAAMWGITNGSISGRWPSEQLLGNLASLPNDAIDGSYVCGTDPQGAQNYRIIKSVVCSLQDIAQKPSDDNTGARCNALSMSLGFTAEPALLGTVYTVSPPPSGCQTEAGAWTDTCF